MPNEASKTWLLALAATGAILVVAGAWGFRGWWQRYDNAFWPHMVINGQDVGGLTFAEAAQRVGNSTPPVFMVEIVSAEVATSASSLDLGLHQDVDQTLRLAQQYGRTGAWWWRVGQLIKLWHSPARFTTPWQFDEQRVSAVVTALAKAVDQPPTPPAARLRTPGQANTLTIEPGVLGQKLATDEAVTAIMTAAAGLQDTTLTLEPQQIGIALNELEQVAAASRAGQLVGKRLLLTSPYSNFRLTDQQIIALLDFPEGLTASGTAELATEWSATINQPPVEPVFEYNPETLRVTHFSPPRNGLTVQSNLIPELLEKLISDLTMADRGAEVSGELPVTQTPPTQSLADTNSLGISELVGVGTSEYAGSIPSRTHNVALTTQRINNFLIKPGEEFKFNEALGEVSRQTGFQPAYIIQGNQTVLGDGGGVCQVSTTLFRAVLNAGLEVTRRLPHSYRVSYYELDSKPGVDATVYSGNIDLRFRNDTDHYILLHATADSKNLTMRIELYGTSDGRTAELTDHQVWDHRPPPPAQYILDSSLPSGTVRQIDWSASGVKASFKNVIKDEKGQIIRVDEYFSNYRPWAAKYLQGP